MQRRKLPANAESQQVMEHLLLAQYNLRDLGVWLAN